MQIFQRHSALSSEAPVYRKLFKSALVAKRIPDTRKQIHNSVVGWSRPLLSVIMKDGAQFFANSFQECRGKSELKAVILGLQYELLEKQKHQTYGQ